LGDVVAQWRASYAPGSWYVMSGPTALVLLQPGALSASLVTRLWPLVVGAASMSELVNRLAGDGLTELPDLAVFFWSAEGMRSLVRGRVRVTDARTGRVVAEGRGVLTWSESALRDITRVSVETGDQAGADSPALPLVVGVVTASRLSLDASAEAVVRSPQVADQIPPESSGAASTATAPDSPVAPGSVVPVVAAVGTLAGAAGDSVRVISPAASAGHPGREVEWGRWPVQPSPVGGAGSAVDEDDTVPPAEPRPAAPGSTGSTRVATDEIAAPSVGTTAPLPPVAGPERRAGGAGDQAELHEGDNITTERLAFADIDSFDEQQFAVENDTTELMQPASAPEEEGPQQPVVEGLPCPLGHVNPPEARHCGVCGAPIPARPPLLLPRPLLARLRAIDGTVVDLDRVVLIGRAPSEEQSDAVLPRLMPVTNPGQDISRTHLQVAPEGWQVVVTDLHSTNGTYLSVPGGQGSRSLLKPGEPTAVPLGAVLELGEGVTVSVDPPH